MTAPGFAACLVFMAVSLAACQSADSGTGGQKENIAAVREQDGAGQTDQENHAAKGENAQDTGTPRGQEVVPDTPDMEAGQETAAEQQGGGRFDDSGPVADGSWIRHMQKGRTSPVCIGHGRKPDENR